MAGLRVPLLISVVVHVFLLYSLHTSQGGKNDGSEDGKGNGGSAEVKFDIIDKFQGDGPVATEDCEDWFGGIGVTYRSWLDQAVVRVHRGYPAEAAGIKEGDIILNKNIIGTVGEAVDVHVMRNGQPLTFHIIRGKICTNRMP